MFFFLFLFFFTKPNTDWVVITPSSPGCSGKGHSFFVWRSVARGLHFRFEFIVPTEDSRVFVFSLFKITKVLDRFILIRYFHKSVQGKHGVCMFRFSCHCVVINKLEIVKSTSGQAVIELLHNIPRSVTNSDNYDTQGEFGCIDDSLDGSRLLVNLYGNQNKKMHLEKLNQGIKMKVKSTYKIQ